MLKSFSSPLLLFTFKKVSNLFAWPESIRSISSEMRFLSFMPCRFCFSLSPLCVSHNLKYLYKWPRGWFDEKKTWFIRQFQADIHWLCYLTTHNQHFLQVAIRTVWLFIYIFSCFIYQTVPNIISDGYICVCVCMFQLKFKLKPMIIKSD